MITQTYNADCFDILKDIPNDFIDCIICDLPYGTTGLCCKRLNRDFVGIEKEQKYYEIAQQRIKGQI